MAEEQKLSALVAEVKQVKNVFAGLSIKNSATLDYSALADKISTELTTINAFDPSYLKATEDVGEAVVKALMVDPSCVG